MIEWIKNLICKEKYIPTDAELAKERDLAREKYFADLPEAPPPIVYEYKVYMKDSSKSITIRATSCFVHSTLYTFYFRNTIVGLFEKDIVKYIKADIPVSLLPDSQV